VDLYLIQITETDNGNITTQLVAKGMQKLVLGGREINKTYKYSIKAKDNAGNLSADKVISITIPSQGEKIVKLEEKPLPIEEVLPPDVNPGDLIKGSASSAVYYVGQDKKKHRFANEFVYYSYYSEFSGLKVFSDNSLAQIPMGKDVIMRAGTYLMKQASSAEVYAVEPNGVLLRIENEQVAKKLYGNKWTDRVIDLPQDVFQQYQLGNPISSAVHPTGSLITYSGSSKIYYIDNGSKREVSVGVFTQSRFQDRFVAKSIDPNISYPTGEVMTAMTDVGYFQ